MSDQFSQYVMDKRVLVVDDSLPITCLLKEILTQAGAEVTDVQSAQEAMALVQTESYDLLVLDLVMPDITGWDLLRFLGSVCPCLLNRTLLLTGDRYHKRTMEWINGVELPVLFKPFSLEELRQAITAVLASTDTQAANACSNPGCPTGAN